MRGGCRVVRQTPPARGGFAVQYWCAPRVGCTDPTASNYEPAATFHARCSYFRTPRTQSGPKSQDSQAQLAHFTSALQQVRGGLLKRAWLL